MNPHDDPHDDPMHRRPPGGGPPNPLDSTTLRRDGSRAGWGTDWIDDDDDAGRAGPSAARRRLVLMAAAVPWLIVVLLLVLPGRFGGDSGPTRDDTARETDGLNASSDHDLDVTNDPAESTPDLDVSEEADGSMTDPEAPDQWPGTQADTSDLDLMEVRGAWRVTPGDELAAVVAVAVGRAWLTGMDPPLDLPGLATPEAPRYAEHLAVEAVERLSADAAVVTILAIVLEGEDALAASVQRLAVPIVWGDDGPRPGGSPWPLAPPDLSAAPLPAGTSVTDPDAHLEAIRALEVAGFAEVELLDLATSGLGPVVARIAARGPDGEPFAADVWLRPHLDGFVVSGTALPAAEPWPGHAATDIAGSDDATEEPG